MSPATVCRQHNNDLVVVRLPQLAPTRERSRLPKMIRKRADDAAAAEAEAATAPAPAKQKQERSAPVEEDNCQQRQQHQQQQQPVEAEAEAEARPGPAKAPPPHPRLPRNRPNLRRQVIVTAGAAAGDHHNSLELASVLPVAPAVPPKRPTRLPARYATGLGIHGQAAGGEQKPNRYSWAQMQQWQAAAAASASANKQQAPATGQQGFQHHFSSPFSSAASRVLVVNPMQIVNLSEHTKSSLIKFIEAIKRFSEKWFSHVLLLLFLAVYACLGAYIFISFEAPTEHWEKQLIIDTRANIVNDSWHEAQGRTRDSFVDLFRVKLEDYERLLNRACASGMTSSSLENQWTFWGALFYSMTVFTTIGYGHLTPITFAGRVATMVYAIFGIPILLMVLADLGKLLTRIIKYAFKKFRYIFNKLMRRKSKTKELIDDTHQYIGVARDAFERGFAYVQHQPVVSRVNSFKQKLFLRHQHQQQHPAGEPAGELADEPALAQTPSLPTPTINLTGDQVFGTQTSDVIVTPAKQTKPVSPPIGAERKCITGANVSASSHHLTALSSQQNHNQHHQTHRSQSPAFRIRRKVSTSGLMASRRHAQAAKSSLSKSSSSNVVSNKKHSDTSSALPPVMSAEQAGTSGNSSDKLGANSTGASDVGATTDEIIDVEPELAMDEEPDEEEDEEGEEEEEEEENDELEDGEEEEEDEFDIPVSFALFLLVTYMMFGAVVFSIWEGWNFFDSLYFVFISMSTIGFGDLVPQHPKRMIGTFIYLLFGLALTSMCINVVQEKIHATFLRAKMQIGEKMGFDLDQIMADDYYDGSLVYDVEGAESQEDANSLAVSQTNSATGAPIGDRHAALAGDRVAHLDSARLNSQSFDGTQQAIAHNHDQTTPVAGLRQSKSRESLRGKKRNVTSVGGHATSASGAGSSIKRKPSKRVSRQATPLSSTTATVHLAGDQPATVNCTSKTETTTSSNITCGSRPAPPSPSVSPHVVPLRSHAEVHRLEPLTVDRQPQPSINEPRVNIKSICEPLRVKLRDELCSDSNRPKLTTTRSLQPYGQIQTEPYRRAAVRSRPVDSLRAASEAPANRRLPVKSSSYQDRSDLEAALSRRSSVSQELNQLDDLITALGRSPSDKFGPLLGIPSSARSSRSNSPSGQLARRGTSMTSRPPSSKPLQAPKQASVSSFHNIPPLNLSESQAALDELEAVKFRS